MARSVKDLAVYRYERASEELANARDLLAEGKYKLALNRSYYAIFHAMRAVNALDEFDSSKHSGVIAYFNRTQVKTGNFPRETSKRIGSASSMREHADYEDFYIATRQDAEEQIQNAAWFLDKVCTYLKDRAILDL